MKNLKISIAIITLSLLSASCGRVKVKVQGGVTAPTEFVVDVNHNFDLPLEEYEAIFTEVCEDRYAHITNEAEYDFKVAKCVNRKMNRLLNVLGVETDY